MNLITSIDQLTMSSREIAELTGKQISHIHRDFKTMAAELGLQDKASLTPNPNLDLGFMYVKDNQNRIREIHLNQELTMTLVSGYNVKLRNSIIKRWQELENQHLPATPKSFPEALRLAAEQAERVEALEKQAQENAPKVAFAEQVEVAPDAISVAQAAKILGTGQRRLFSKLRELKWVTRRNEPYQDKIEAGLLDVKLGSWQHPDHGLKQSVTALITGKGLSKLQLLLSIPASSPLFSSAQMSAHQMGEK
ncbi:DNA-binding protein [Agarivorans sp. B2Z047]|uniref:phage antirepressor KilAC domain-containing protein n=1 Tax=Agarivorans sp. B2Z047 TaxID=2652721 RepID=UPI00128BC29B|nr:phage antirepressor KilAC domain-containing protein [Agarivorans sp. B2Z047]MPW31931.1 DNA-binding protein [Agarivorans sp. B2Z047]UQN41901.1 phage regulatory protein/antirepressor Ant [Agarivorans sp. B2Z047]